jgi:mycothiol synthase
MAGLPAADITLRAPRSREAEAVAQIVNSDTNRVFGTDDTTVPQVLGGWRSPGTDLDRDVVVAVAGERIVGYAHLLDAGREHTQFWLRAIADPANRDVVAALTRRLERRARELARPGAVVRVSVPTPDRDKKRLLGGELGYCLVRHAFRMEIELQDELPTPEWPDGIGVRTFEPGADDESAYEATMEAFEHHWGFVREPIEDWRHWLLREPFDPSLCFLAVDGDEVAGFCMCPPHKGGQPELAWVDDLGVRPAWRRRGLALALLRHAFREFRRRGFRRAGLGVDGENTTGAVRLYERAGMHVARRWDQYEKPLDG